MNYNEAMNFISSLKTVSLKPSLERIKALLKALGNPEKEQKVIHIAGTNGKGSVASITASVLKEAGYKVGLFTSPYIVCFRERIRINGEMISEETLAELCNIVKNTFDKIKDKITLSQFEFVTTVAFLYFKRQKCDYVVLETGLGGRYDATNVFENPICSIITCISLDHTNVIGKTISEIAYEKAGIIKNNTPVFSSYQVKEAMKVIKEEAKIRNAPIFIADRFKATNVCSNMEKTSFVFEGTEYETNLLGDFQIENAFISVVMLKQMFPDINNSVVNEGLKKVFHPGRMEIISKNPHIILDGAHNPDAARKISEFLQKNKWQGNILFSALKDKDYDSVLKELSILSNTIVLVAMNDLPRAESVDELKNKAQKYFKNCIIANDFRNALTVGGSSMLACGSLYFISEIRSLLIKDS